MRSFGRPVRLAAGLILAAAALVVAPGQVAAATPCHPVQVGKGTSARVAKVGVPCASAREVATTYFERVRASETYDGKTRDGSAITPSRGFAV